MGPVRLCRPPPPETVGFFEFLQTAQLHNVRYRSEPCLIAVRMFQSDIYSLSSAVLQEARSRNRGTVEILRYTVTVRTSLRDASTTMTTSCLVRASETLRRCVLLIL
jgi:hypothetical protein